MFSKENVFSNIEFSGKLMTEILMKQYIVYKDHPYFPDNKFSYRHGTHQLQGPFDTFEQCRAAIPEDLKMVMPSFSDDPTIYRIFV